MIGGEDRLTGTMTFLFTDVVGSTPLWDRYPHDMKYALELHDGLVRESVAQHGGCVFSTAGDSFALAFRSASSAIEAGVAVQVALKHQRWPGEIDLQVRAGAHSGEAYERDGDYFGSVVNRAARLMGAANGGQFIVSAVTAALARADTDVDFVELGPVRVKGIVDPIEAVGVCSAALPWVGASLTTEHAVVGNLRSPRTEFIGDLAGLQRRVASLSSNRLVTLTGSGGVGKTRAATEIGLLVADDFPGGIWMCELAPITEPDAIVPAVVESLGARPQAGLTGVDVIVDWCQERRVLVILDNCEHLVGSVADLASELADRSPTLTMLATSREPLGVAGEQVVRVPSLELEHGVELFVDRATALDSEFSRERDRVAVEAICRRLDGIPLAIELAAARVRSLSPAEILDRLDERFRLLRGSGRGGLERHQTLQAAVDWSYKLLSPASQDLFDQLSVFAGSFDLAAVEAICDVRDRDVEPLDVVAELVDKSMVVAVEAGRRTRYRLLETLRQYGERRLDERNETGKLRDRHSDYFTNEATRLSSLAYTRGETTYFAFIDAEWDNLRAAFTWSIALDEIDAAEQLLLATAARAELQVRDEHAEWANEVIELGERLNRPSALGLGLQACWAQQFGESVRAVELATTGAQVEGTVASDIICEIWRSEGLVGSGRAQEAVARFGQLRQIVAGTESNWLRCKARNMILNALVGAGDPSYAAEIEDAREFYEGTDSLAALSLFSFYRGHALLYAISPPTPAQAHEEYRVAAEAAAGVGNSQLRMWCEHSMVVATLLGGDLEIGAELRRVLQESHDARLWQLNLIGLEVTQLFHARRGSLDHAATILGFVEGRPMPFEAISAPYRAEVATLIVGQPNADLCRERGAAMDPHAIVTYAIDSLRDV